MVLFCWTFVLVENFTFLATRYTAKFFYSCGGVVYMYAVTLVFLPMFEKDKDSFIKFKKNRASAMLSAMQKVRVVQKLKNKYNFDEAAVLKFKKLFGLPMLKSLKSSFLSFLNFFKNFSKEELHTPLGAISSTVDLRSFEYFFKALNKIVMLKALLQDSYKKRLFFYFLDLLLIQRTLFFRGISSTVQRYPVKPLYAYKGYGILKRFLISADVYGKDYDDFIDEFYTWGNYEWAIHNFLWRKSSKLRTRLDAEDKKNYLIRRRGFKKKKKTLKNLTSAPWLLRRGKKSLSLKKNLFKRFFLHLTRPPRSLQQQMSASNKKDSKWAGYRFIKSLYGLVRLFMRVALKKKKSRTKKKWLLRFYKKRIRGFGKTYKLFKFYRRRIRGLGKKYKLFKFYRKRIRSLVKKYKLLKFYRRRIRSFGKKYKLLKFYRRRLRRRIKHFRLRMRSSKLKRVQFKKNLKKVSLFFATMRQFFIYKHGKLLRPGSVSQEAFFKHVDKVKKRGLFKKRVKKQDGRFAYKWRSALKNNKSIVLKKSVFIRNFLKNSLVKKNLIYLHLETSGRNNRISFFDWNYNLLFMKSAKALGFKTRKLRRDLVKASFLFQKLFRVFRYRVRHRIKNYNRCRYVIRLFGDVHKTTNLARFLIKRARIRYFSIQNRPVISFNGCRGKKRRRKKNRGRNKFSKKHIRL